MAKIILTGDRPTGKLHLGHFVGSLSRRVELQNTGLYDKIFIMIADAQALTDNADNPDKVRENIIEVDYKFVELEDGVSYISTEEFIRKMFNPFRVQWKSRIEKAEGKQQYVYEIVDKNYEKPIILRNMPFLSNHLSTHEGVIGVYLDLNKNLQPAIQIRYAEPMTAEELWSLMTMETWTITYKADDVRQEPAKLSFKSEGTVYEYTE